VDLDGDSRMDLLSGSYPGPLHLFRGRGDGTYREGITLTFEDGEQIDPGSATAPFASDWDRDGDLDILVGDGRGQVRLVRNLSGGPGMAFIEGGLLTASDEPVRCKMGEAAPLVADWDGDGSHDLLLGTGNGQVLFYRNLVREGTPQLAGAVELLPPSPMAERGPLSSQLDLEPGPGIRTRLAVADWDGDGRADLLVGGFALGGPAEELSPSQRQELERMTTVRDSLQGLIAAITDSVETAIRLELLLPPEKGAWTRSERETFGVRRYLALRDLPRLEQLRVLATEASVEVSRRSPPGGRHTYHGWVWVYLRR